MRQFTITVAAATALLLAATSTAAHIPGHCIPAGLEEAIDRKSALSAQISAAANNDQLMELLNTLPTFMQVDGRLSQMMGSMLSCSVR